MTLRQVLRLRLQKVTVPTEQTGDDKLYHYFQQKFNGIPVFAQEDSNGEWYVSVFEYNCRFYTYRSAKQLIDLISCKGTNYDHNSLHL
jgi:hypothetical protein